MAFIHSDTSSNATLANSYSGKKAILPLILVISLFFMWGVANNLNDILIKQFKKSFVLSDFQSGLVQSAFYLGYFLLAMPAARLMKKYGYKAGILLGLVLYATGAFLFYPAAEAHAYGFFLTALFVIASGLAFLETAANPYITILGPPETAEWRLNLAQSFNPVGAIVGILIGRSFIFSGTELSEQQMNTMAPAALEAYLHQETRAVQMPYLIIGCIVLFWAMLIYFTRFPEPTPTATQEESDQNVQSPSLRQLFAKRHFVMGVLAQFLYVGAQVGIWSYTIRYAQFSLPGTSEFTAANYLTFSLIFLMIGRFVGTALMKRIPAPRLMSFFAAASVLLTLCGVFIPGIIGMWAIILISFFMSIMFPTIFSLSVKGLGSGIKLGASLVIMSIIGGAILPALMGLVSDASNIRYAFLFPVLCFAYILWYSSIGYKQNIEA